MQLVADRFIVVNDRRVIDRATGSAVTLAISSAEAPADDIRWMDRCDGLARLHHRCLASLVDYGSLGDGRRFEVWACDSRWNGTAAAGAQAVATASRVLRGCGLSAGPSDAVYARNGRAVMIPGAGSGYPVAASRPPAAAAIEHHGLRLLGRPAVSVFAELLDIHDGSRPRALLLVGPGGSGKTVLLREIARLARVKGLMVVSLDLVRSVEVPRGRSVCLIADEHDEVHPRGRTETAWSALTATVSLSPRPHVLIVAAQEESRGIPCVHLDRLSEGALVDAVQPAIFDRRLQRLVVRAARLARGLPGRFEQLVWGTSVTSGRGQTTSRVAEQPATYGANELDAVPAVKPSGSDGAVGLEADVNRWQSRLARSLELLESGRHASGVRKIRQIMAALVRRRAWDPALRAAISLAWALLQRGQAARAHAVLEDASRFRPKSGTGATVIDLSIVAGEAWIDLARLDEAEAVLSTAVSAARAAGDARRAASASLSLGRSLFWGGRYAEADEAIKPSRDGALPADTELRLLRLIARVAVGRRDLVRAMGGANDAIERARAGASPRGLAAATCCAAFVHLAAGDLAGVEREVSTSVAAARAVHDPLRAWRARIVQAAADWRSGRLSAARSRIDRLRRIPALPPILRARCDLLDELLTGGTAAPEVASRRARSSGLEALTLLVPVAPAAPMPWLASGADLDDIVELMGLCQTAEDDTALLAEACVRVRRQLHASSVVCVEAGRGADGVVAGSGARADFGIVQRAVTAGVLIAPHRLDDRIEGAAPIGYGGTIIGVLAARWTLGTTYDLARAPGVLTMVAAAIAPLVRGALARRLESKGTATGGLLGATSALIDLRRSVERAGSAPYPVLVQGESGVGKELVARAVHRTSSRRDRAFCTVNCAALPEDLIEAELFGHARGAFTGAVGERAGVFEEAHGGSLFLDEVGELSPRAQAKLLRVIQEGELRRVGENLSRRIDVRLVAATNRDLAQEAAAGRFRSDLLYRLDVIRLEVPPLRERREDIALLAAHFWADAARRVGSRATLASTTVAALARYDWPGNVRELQNVLAALAVRCPKRGVVPPTALPPHVTGAGGPEPCRLEAARRVFEERFVRAALVRSGGRRTPAAAELGVTRQGLTKLMARLGIEG